jgi:rhodanese-related sulfurtransferase
MHPADEALRLSARRRAAEVQSPLEEQPKPCSAAPSVMPHTTPDQVTEYDPHEVKELLAAGRILLVDVREPAEYAAERIPGALLYPLSTFDVTQLPPDESRQVVFSCAAGGRSLTAARQRLAQGQPAAHLAGGISEWKAVGLPTIRIDPRTGRPM